jgi:hypothetical protein
MAGDSDFAFGRFFLYFFFLAFPDGKEKGKGRLHMVNCCQIGL